MLAARAQNSKAKSRSLGREERGLVMTALLRPPSGRGTIQTREDFPDAVDLTCFPVAEEVTTELEPHRISRLTVRALV